MRVELRPDIQAVNRPSDPPILDEAVIEGACSVHAEMMDYQMLWIGIENADGKRVSLIVSVAEVRGKHVLELRGEQDA